MVIAGPSRRGAFWRRFAIIVSGHRRGQAQNLERMDVLTSARSFVRCSSMVKALICNQQVGVQSFAAFRRPPFITACRVPQASRITRMQLIGSSDPSLAGRAAMRTKTNRSREIAELRRLAGAFGAAAAMGRTRGARKPVGRGEDLRPGEEGPMPIRPPLSTTASATDGAGGFVRALPVPQASRSGGAL